MQPDQIVAELLARGDMNEETTLDLNRILDAWRAGQLEPDDETYLREFHARIMNLVPETAPQLSPVAEQSTLLEGLTIKDWRERAMRAEAELARIEEAAREG